MQHPPSTQSTCIVLAWVSRFVLAYCIENLAIHHDTQRHGSKLHHFDSRFAFRFAIRFDSPFLIRLIHNLIQVALQQFDSIHNSVQAVYSPLCLPFLPICVFPRSVVLCFILVWNICRVPAGGKAGVLECNVGMLGDTG